MNDIKQRLARAEATWDMAENIFQQLADQVRQHEYDIILTSIVIALFSTTVQARNEYLNDGTNSCDQGSWEAYTEVRQHEYKSGNNDESQKPNTRF